MLTKSRFVLALDCVTKLYYTKNPAYADQSVDDPFLEALAQGGFQVGELAKYRFCDDPIRDRITITTLDTDEAVAETTCRLQAERCVIAEAAFVHGNLLVRTDIIVKDGKQIDLFEVKAKSTDADDEQFVTRTRGGKPAAVSSKWRSYLYDVAFQKYVMEQALAGQGYTISASLLLVDKSQIATVNGLNQKFRIVKDGNRKRVETEPGIRSIDLGESLLKAVPVDDVIERIWHEFEVPTDHAQGLQFGEFVRICETAYREKRRIDAPIGTKCKACQFQIDGKGPDKLKSGFLECWRQTGLADAMLMEGLVFDLWAGNAGGLIGDLIQRGVYRLEDIGAHDIPLSAKGDVVGLTPSERRWEQIRRTTKANSGSFFDAEGFRREAGAWNYPLHMIDFETSVTALPFHKGRRPYETVAFQFSHHTIDERGNVRHAGEYISFEKGVFPNYEFIRALKKELEQDNGSIFRYHNHENTVLRTIHRQLSLDVAPPADRDELLSFIDLITKDSNSSHIGARAMIDLYKLVLAYYYSPKAKGSNSIKQILPAVIADSPFLRERYGRPIYGAPGGIPSKNFVGHTWISKEFANDPYKTLRPLLQEYDEDHLERSLDRLQIVNDGASAMTAYNMLQYSNISDAHRDELRRGLLRYCELDTMAMVMITEAWHTLLPSTTKDVRT